MPKECRVVVGTVHSLYRCVVYSDVTAATAAAAGGDCVSIYANSQVAPYGQP